MSKEIIIESVNCNDQLVDMLTIFGDLKFNVFLLSLEMLQLGGSVGVCFLIFPMSLSL